MLYLSDVIATVCCPLAGAAASSQLVRPLILVSDLDDTLIGSTPAADAATAAFKVMWDRSKAAGVRCTLAVNTGRYARHGARSG